MTLKCYNKPNRTKIRTFTLSDLQRISKIVKDDSGISTLAIIGAVILGLGLGFTVCRANDALKNISSLVSLINKLTFIATFALAIRVLITFLLTNPIARIPPLNIVSLIVVTGLLIVEQVLKQLDDFVKDIAFLSDISNGLDVICTSIKKLVSNHRANGTLDKISKQDRLLAL